MKHNYKRFLAMVLAVVMVMGMMPLSVFAADSVSEPITGVITEDTVWNDGDVIGGVTIQGDVTITVNGTVTVAGTIGMYIDSLHTVTIQGGTADAKLIRGNSFAGQMFYVEGDSYVFQNLNIKNLILDGGAVWTGETDAILNRGTVNEGIKANGSVLYLVRAHVVLDNCTLQNHDDGTGEKANAVFLREYASVAFNDSVVRNNNSPSGYWKGGVVTTRYGGIVTANNAEIYGNSASHGGFVGVSTSGSYGTKVDCVNTKLHHNYASVGGAVFYLQDNGSRIFQTLGDNRYSYVKLDGCTLENNGSPNGLFYSWVYFMPAWIKDTTIANNDCAIYTFNQDNRSFSVAGKTNITSDREDGLYQNPVRIYGALDAAASIPMTEATVTRLMGNYGYLVTATPDIPHAYNHTSDGTYVVTYEYTSRALHDITLADLAQVDLYEGSGYTGWILTDVDGNGMMDAVPVNVADTTVNVTLTDTFKGAGDTQTQDVSTVVENVPVCYYEHTGYFFNGWLMEDGTLIKDVNSNVILSGGENLTAAWAVARPRFTISADKTKAEVGESVTLTPNVTNMNTEYLGYTYQWYKDGTAIEGATGSTYTVTEADAGFYSYQCTITATDDTYTSDTDYASKTTYGTAKRKKNIVLQFTETPEEPVYVAQVVETGVKYTSVQEALNACTNGETVKLLTNITYQQEDAVPAHGGGTGFGKYDAYNPAIVYLGGTKGATDAENQPSNVNAVLDLNGYTITNDADAYMFLIMDNAKLTFTDSVGTGSVNTTTNAPVIWAVGTDTLVTIEDGKYTTANAEGLLWSTHGADLVINGGEFDSLAETDSLLIIRNSQDRRNPNYFVDGKATVTVYGGTYHGFDPETMLDDSTDPYTEFNAVAKGYKSVNDAEANTWTVVPNQIFEMHLTDANGEAHWLSPMRSNDINSLIEKSKVWYDSLQGTYSFTLKVLESYELDETVLATFPMTIDLCGNTLTVAEAMSATPAVRVLSDVTVTNGTVDATAGSSTYAFIVGNSETEGKLTITDGTYEGDTTAVSVTKGQLNISGGNFEATEYDGAHEFTLNCIDANYADGSAVISLTGGTYYGFDPENCAAEGAGTNFCAKHYMSIDNGDNTWTVKSAVEAGYVCWNMQTGVYYETVSAGLDEAKGGETVQLLTTTSDNYVLVSPNTTLDLNGWTLTANYVVGFTTSAICDSTNNEANGYIAQGLLAVDPVNMVLYEGNGAVPVYNPEKGGYIFVDFLFKSEAIQQDGITTVNMSATSKTMEFIELLKDGAADNDIQIALRLAWDEPTGTAYQDFVFNEDTVQHVMQSNNGKYNSFGLMFYVNISGLENLTGVTATPMVISGSNAFEAGKTMNVN